LKLASFQTGRKLVVAFTKAFHGRTSLAVAATDNTTIIAPVNETANVVFLPFNDEEAAAAFFRKNGSEVSSVIIEPIQGVGGINVAATSFLKLLRGLCDQYGALLIADEVQCGYGRTGNFFAMDGAGIQADIYTMAKGMGNGFPVGGILIAPHVQSKHGMLGTTFGGNHLACAAALAVLEIMEAENLMSNAASMGIYLQGELKKMEGIENVRGAGLMIGFDVNESLKDLRKVLLSAHHIFTGEAKPAVIRLLPALNITRQQVDAFLSCIAEAVTSMQQQKEAVV